MHSQPEAKTFASLFSGFGGADIGAMQAGLVPVWGVEYVPEIAEVANANLGGHVRVADILDLSPATFDRVDVLHASPPCPNFSVAKSGGKETAHDLAMAQKVAEFVTVLRPQVFTLENVWGYRNSQSWAVIRDALYEAGYWLNVEHVNAADMGVPQTRKRMIVRAVLGGWVPYLPAPVPWVSWYAAIEDLLPTLPESKLAPWQLARLPDDLRQSLLWAHGPIADDEPPVMRKPDKPSMTLGTTSGPYNAVLINGGNEWAVLVTNQRQHKTDENGDRLPSMVVENDPAPAILSGSATRSRAVMIDPNNTSRDATLLKPSSPAMTVSAQHGRRPSSMPFFVDSERAILFKSESTAGNTGIVVCDQDDPSFGIRAGRAEVHRAQIGARVVAMTPRCLARFQSFPDWYELPAKKTLAARGIGNAVPPLMYQRIVEGLVQA